MPRSRQKLQQLLEVAKSSLVGNIVHIEAEATHYLAAGFYQFRSLWTRDFCWAVRGLVALEDPFLLDVATRQLDRLFSCLPDHEPEHRDILPRVLDNMNTTSRVVKSVVRRAQYPLRAPLRSEVLDQHGRIAFDGNALAVLVAARHLRQRRPAWWKGHVATMRSLLAFYKRHHEPDGILVHQPPFSDWQDSVDRRGATFYCNLLYACALEAVADEPAFGVDRAELAALRRRIHDVFFDRATGLYRSVANREQVSLDGNLLAIDLDYLPHAEKVELYRRLLEHPLWDGPEDGAGGGPGFVTWPRYAHREKDWMVRSWLVGLRHYHDSLYWSWLIALAAKVSHQMEPHVPGARAEADKLYGRLVAMAARDNVIGEVYWRGDTLYEVRPRRFKSDRPFSWGAGFVIDAVTYALEHAS